MWNIDVPSVTNNSSRPPGFEPTAGGPVAMNEPVGCPSACIGFHSVLFATTGIV
jgi:hypothetical protein